MVREEGDLPQRRAPSQVLDRVRATDAREADEERVTAVGAEEHGDDVRPRKVDRVGCCSAAIPVRRPTVPGRQHDTPLLSCCSSCLSNTTQQASLQSNLQLLVLRLHGEKQIQRIAVRYTRELSTPSTIRFAWS